MQISIEDFNLKKNKIMSNRNLTIEDLKKLGSKKVREDETLMEQYVSLFTEKFGETPNCVPCTFDKDWNRLMGNTSSSVSVVNSSVTFQLKDLNDNPYSFDEYDKETGRYIRKRSYGYNMTEEFAVKYLTVGTTEQIEERKTRFKVLPAQILNPALDTTEDVQDGGFDGLNKSELQSIATEKGYSQEEWGKLKKDDLIAYLKAKALDTPEDVQDGENADELK